MHEIVAVEPAMTISEGLDGQFHREFLHVHAIPRTVDSEDLNGLTWCEHNDILQASCFVGRKGTSTASAG